MIFHLAAQALVRRGYAQPAATFATNLMGTVNLLEAAGAAPDLRAVLVVTTDKVYANRETSRPYHEQDPLGGDDPYAASKACAEIAAGAWARALTGHLPGARPPGRRARRAPRSRSPPRCGSRR
jgi:CDP-glucose 4,6-dehydratase